MNKIIGLYIKNEWHFLDLEGEIYSVEASILVKEDRILITLQTSDLLRQLNASGVDVIPPIIDLESFDRQHSQRGKDLRGSGPWSLLRTLKYHLVVADDFSFEQTDILGVLMLIKQLYLHLDNCDEVERKRFENIELPINQILYTQQVGGLRFDSNHLEEKCAELERRIYEIKNTLQLDHGVFEPGNSEFQLSYLKSKEFPIIRDITYSFKIRRGNDAISKLIYQMIRDERDLDSFLFMLSHWGSADKTYPSYHGFGSITSRITMRQPAIQNLQKGNRSILIPDPLMKFLHIDYSQFEAGILASLSGDEALIKKYNEGDIYEDLATKVFQDKDRRADAKILFYRYLYGDDTLGKLVSKYFASFQKLEIYRTGLYNSPGNENRIGTIEGNFRYWESNNSWLLSHAIQATASLIFKKALISVNKNVPGASLLVPMHDGALYQVYEDEFETKSEKISEIFKNEFDKACPKIQAKVTITDSF